MHITYRKMLSGLLLSLYEKAEVNEHRAFWALLAKKVADNQMIFSELEINLMTKALDRAIDIGEVVLNKSTEDEEAGVRAQALISSLKLIKENVCKSKANLSGLEGSTKAKPKQEKT